MAYEHKDNSGSIFVNDRKEKETHPDMTGRAVIGGVRYWVNLWHRKGGDGTEYDHVTFKPVEEHGQEDQTRRQPPPRPAPPQRQPLRPPQRPPQRQPPPPRQQPEIDPNDIPW